MDFCEIFYIDFCKIFYIDMWEIQDTDRVGEVTSKDVALEDCRIRVVAVTRREGKTIPLRAVDGAARTEEDPLDFKSRNLIVRGRVGYPTTNHGEYNKLYNQPGGG